MQNIYDNLQGTFLGNTIASYCWFVGIILLGLIFQRLLSKLLTLFVFRFLKKYSQEVGYEKFLVLTKKPMGILILLITFYLAFDRLEFPREWNLVSVESFGLKMIIFRLFQIAIVISITWILLRMIDYFGLILIHRTSLTESKSDDQLVPFIKEAIKVIVVIFSVFFILGAIFKLNIASLIAGLGIGGLAIALAAKESLENLLGSFTIFLDKPFVVGDLIQIGDLIGNVERIGFRSTRIRTLEKSFVTVPNKKLVDGELDNLSLRTQRRAKFNVALSYETTVEQFQKIVPEIQKIIDDHSHTLNGETRVRMYNFDTNAINILVIYYVNTMEYDVYLNVRQEINFKIMEIIQKHGSSFAHPSPAIIHLNK